jgi:hypothetical protein
MNVLFVEKDFRYEVIGKILVEEKDVETKIKK